MEIMPSHLLNDSDDSSLMSAISLQCANCYAAMAMANAIGGSRTKAWLLCHAYSLEMLLEEAEKRKLDLSNLQAAVEYIPVQESLYYKRAKGIISLDEFNKEFYRWQRGDK